MKKIYFIAILLLVSFVFPSIAQNCNKELSKNRRVRVNSNQLKGDLLRVVQLDIRRKVWLWNEKYNATAAFIHPRVLITAGHNLTDRFDPVSKIRITVGFTNNNTYLKQQDVYTEMNRNIYVLPSYKENPTYEDDFGIIILPDSSLYKSARGHFILTPYVPSRPPKALFLSGYPDPVTGIKLWTDKTSNFFYTPNLLRYDFFTVEGSSGSPVYTGMNQLVGIHTGGFEEKYVCNIGTPITVRMKGQISQWCRKHGIILE
jgi:V8-like Glu-specific endopeptidase